MQEVCTYSLLGVIVAEILASNQGLGYLIESGAGNFNTAGVFAGLIVLSVVTWLELADAQDRSAHSALETFRRECLA